MHEYPPDARIPERPREDPWHVVCLVMHDLSAHGIKNTYREETHLGAAATAAAALLESLGVEAIIEEAE